MKASFNLKGKYLQHNLTSWSFWSSSLSSLDHQNYSDHDHLQTCCQPLFWKCLFLITINIIIVILRHVVNLCSGNAQFSKLQPLLTRLTLSHWHRYLLLHFHAGHVIIIIFYWQGWYDHTGTGHYAHHRSDQYYHSGHVTDDHHCHHHYHHKLATCNIRLTLTGHCPLTGLIFGINMPFISP